MNGQQASSAFRYSVGSGIAKKPMPKRNSSLNSNPGDKRVICLFFGQLGAVSDDEERVPDDEGRTHV